MSILVECKCGRKFEVPISLQCFKPNNESLSVQIGSAKCPNPKCNEVIWIDAIIMSDTDESDESNESNEPIDPVVHGSVDWNETKESDILFFNGKEYEIVLKTIRESDRILYLRPITTGENVIVKVEENGKVAGVWWFPKELFSLAPPPLRTALGYESWSEDQLNAIKINSIRILEK